MQRNNKKVKTRVDVSKYNKFTNISQIMKIIIGTLIVIALIFLFGFIFNFLFKVGIILLLALGIVYLYKKIVTD